MIYTVLSVRQPWAYCIIKGYKDLENRTWKTDYRGQLAIHSSSSFDFSFLDFLNAPPEWEPINNYADEICAFFGIGEKRRITAHKDHLSAVLGTVNLKDCVEAPEEAIEADPIGNPWCMYTGFAWMLDGAKAFREPITGIKGKLNLWKLEV